jgi:hypothetical protein
MTRSLVWIQSARGDGHKKVAADAREPRTGSVEAEHPHQRIPLSRKDITSQPHDMLSITLYAVMSMTRNLPWRRSLRIFYDVDHSLTML